MLEQLKKEVYEANMLLPKYGLPTENYLEESRFYCCSTSPENEAGNSCFLRARNKYSDHRLPQPQYFHGMRWRIPDRPDLTRYPGIHQSLHSENAADSFLIHLDIR